jgi:hypothetical protein
MQTKPSVELDFASSAHSLVKLGTQNNSSADASTWAITGANRYPRIAQDGVAAAEA